MRSWEFGGITPLICLITPTHVSANPRIVKEANALAEAGYRVHLVAADVNVKLRELDVSIFSHAQWSHSLVPRGAFVSYGMRTILQRLARLLLGKCRLNSLRLASLAHGRLIGGLTKAAKNVSAQLYIAHNLAALPAAASAAVATGAKLGFDAEDFHTEELTDSQRDDGDQVAREIIENLLLPRCDYLTAASPLIAKVYGEKYGVRMEPILNVFPLSEALGNLGPSRLIPRSLYWFSQTIGAGRGLEAFMSAMSEMKEVPMLYLRGNLSEEYRETIGRLAKELHLERHVRFLPVALPKEMIPLAAPYSLGLAIELNTPLNRALCLTNKVFVYLLAGIPVLFSRTPAQDQLARALDDAALIVDLDSPRETARMLESFFQDQKLQQRARARALELGRGRYNWDKEKKTFLRLVAECLKCQAGARSQG
jgi:glycosyltransferase involved in cell wall biosynthesis